MINVEYTDWRFSHCLVCGVMKDRERNSCRTCDAIARSKKTTENGRASICTWDLEFHFRKEEQIREFITLLMKEEVLYDFEYEKTLDETSTLHYIRISGSWANNLVAVAKLADKVDYKYDNSEMYEE